MVKLNDIGKDYSNTCDSCYLDSKEEVGMLFDQLEANLQGLIEWVEQNDKGLVSMTDLSKSILNSLECVLMFDI